MENNIIVYSEEEKIKIVYIYCLKHPITNEIRYIGKANDIRKRLFSHLRDSKKRKTPLYNWINKLKQSGLVPLIETICETNNQQWESDEIRLISEYKEKGVRLLNVAIGGNQPHCNKATLANNGRDNALIIHINPLKKRMWYLKKELASHFKRFGDTPRILEMKNELALRNIYFK